MDKEEDKPAFYTSIGPETPEPSRLRIFFNEKNFIKYFLAIIACIVEAFAYVAICAFLEWKNFGGVFVMAIFMAVLGATWTAIVKRGD